MPISTHLLKRGYQLIDAGQLQNAEMVLDAVVRTDPKNVMAWKAYLQVYQYRDDLEWLMERIVKNNELSDKEKEDIRAYRDYLIQGQSEWKQSSDEANPRRTLCFESVQEAPAQDDTVIFELIDEFDYPARMIEREKRRRSRTIFKYNIPMYVWQAVTLLALFYAGVRLLVFGYIFGFLPMGVFIFGGIYWIRSINDRKTPPPLDVTRAYSLDTKNDLFIIDKPIIDAKVDKNKKDTSSRIRYLDK
jgi:hypothetical protein